MESYSEKIDGFREKGDLEGFKRLLNEGRFDGIEELEGLKGNIAEINAYFYQYGLDGEQRFFEGRSIYHPYFWFAAEIKGGSLYIEEVDRELVVMQKEFSEVSHRLNLGRLVDKEESLHYLKRYAKKGIDKKLYEVDRIGGLYYDILLDILASAKCESWFKLLGIYGELEELPREEWVYYIRYKYLYRNYMQYGLEVDVIPLLEKDRNELELSYYFRHREDKVNKLRDSLERYRGKDFVENIKKNKEEVFAKVVDYSPNPTFIFDLYRCFKLGDCDKFANRIMAEYSNWNLAY